MILLYLLTVWLTLQNMVLAYAYNVQIVSANMAQWIIAVPDAVLFVYVLALLLLRVARHESWSGAEVWAFALLALLTGSLAFTFVFGSPISSYLRVAAYRNLVVPPLFLLAGSGTRMEGRAFVRLTRLVLALAVACGIFGAFEWLVLPLNFWRSTIGIGIYLLDVKHLALGINVSDGLPANLFRLGVRRMMSVYGDPLAFSIALSMPSVVALALWQGRKGRQRSAGWRGPGYLVAAGLLMACLLATIGRESIATAGLAILLLALLQQRLRSLLLMLIAICLALLFSSSLRTSVVQTLSFRESSAAAHLADLLHDAKQVPTLVWGTGLGSAGGWSASAHMDVEVGESSYADQLAQTGAAGLILLLGMFVGCLVILARGRRNPDAPAAERAIYAGLCAYLAARMLMANVSPSLFNFTAIGPTFLLIGVAIRRASLRTPRYLGKVARPAGAS